MSIKKLLYVVAVFITGIVVGVASAGADTAPAAAPAPAKTVTVTKAVTPPECTDALDKGEEVIRIASQGFNIVGDVLAAASQMDVAGIQSGTADLEALTPRMRTARDDYDTAAAQCRGQ